MLNNEFRLIGTIISDWKTAGTEEFPKYEMEIEVERRKKGATSTYTLVSSEKNYVVDVTKSYKGKQVIVSGYIDIYKKFMRLIIQDIIVIGEENTELEVPVSEEKPVDLDIQDIPDDDLPF